MFKFGTGLRSAFRQLQIYPVESTLIVLALALGVGTLSAITAVYGVSDEIARRLRAGLAAREFSIVPSTWDNLTSLQGDQLIAPLRTDQQVSLRFSLDDLKAVSELAPSVDYVYFFTNRAFYVKAVDPGESLSWVYAITADYSKAAGAVDVARGSWFSQTDFDEGRRVVVLAESYVDRLGIEGDPLGQQIPMNYADAGGAPYTVIGVLGPGQAPEPRGGLTVVGYVPFEQASAPTLYAAVQGSQQIAQATEELRFAVERIWNGKAMLQPPASLWQASTRERNRALILAGFASVGLLMASLNITNLMLARVRRRERAMAILRSLGATRSHVRMQVLTEAAILGLIGGLLGIVISQSLLDMLVAIATPSMAELFSSQSLPAVAIIVTLVASAVVTMIIGVVPAARAARSNIVPGTAASTDLAPHLPRPVRRNPVRLALTALQLVISGAAIVVSLHIYTVGNVTKPALSFFTVDAVNANREHSGLQSVFTSQSLGSLRALAPDAAALSEWDTDFNGGVATTPGQEYMIDSIRLVGPDYLSLVGATIISGSPLSGRTDSGSQQELLLEETVAEQVFTTAESAIGKELTIQQQNYDSGDPMGKRTFKVIGVYSYKDIGNAFGPPEHVAAVANPSGRGSLSILAAAEPTKANEAKAQLTAAARAVFGSSYTSEALTTVSLDFITSDLYEQSQIESTLSQAIFLFTLVAIIAVILAAVGIFSLSILNTTERTRDIGIRRALGASRSQIAREIAGSATLTAAISTLLGIAIAWLASPSLSKTLSNSLLAGIEIPQHLSLALVTLGIVLALSGLLGWLVGLRATQASPSTVLSEEGT